MRRPADICPGDRFPSGARVSEGPGFARALFDTKGQPMFIRLSDTQRAMMRVGTVTLSNQEREEPASRAILGGRNCLQPRVHRRGAEGSVRLS